MHRKKALFFDVDGTIVTGDHVVPESAREALYAAKTAGHVLLVNTGRPYLHIEPQIKALPFDGFICSLGGHIVFRGEELYHTGFTPEESREIRDHGRRCGMYMLFESEKGIFCDPDRICRRGEEEYQWLCSIGVPGCTDREEKFAFDKFVCWPGPEADEKAFCDRFADTLDFIRREHQMLEVVRKGLSKAGGMETALELLHIPREDTFAFGDGANDLPMLRQANIGVLMGNAPEFLWPEADYVTDTITCDGLKKALEHFELI